MSDVKFTREQVESVIQRLKDDLDEMIHQMQEWVENDNIENARCVSAVIYRIRSEIQHWEEQLDPSQ